MPGELSEIAGRLWQRCGSRIDAAGVVLSGRSFDSLALQDLLNLGKEARMNIPGRPEGNWGWRCTEDMLTDRAFEWLTELDENLEAVGGVSLRFSNAQNRGCRFPS